MSLNLEPLKPYLRSPNEPDRLYSKGKKIEVVFLIEAVNAILPRTEGVDDITLLKLPHSMIEVPAILPQKLQAVTRRRMLAHLRLYRDQHPDDMRKVLEEIAGLGYTKAKEAKGDPSKWNCYIQPSGAESGNKSLDEGMDGFCPACILFGTVLTKAKISLVESKDKNKDKDVSAGLKSRVEFDVAFAVVDKNESVLPITHNKVSEGVSFTGQSLFTERHVAPGTVFIGKATLEDVTETELKTFLAILAGINRLGGRQSVYGTVRVHLLGIRGGYYETVTPLELAEKVIEKTGGALVPVEKAREIIAPVLESYGFIPITSKSVLPLLEDWDLVKKLWEETKDFDKQVVDKLKEIYGIKKGSEKKKGDK